MYMGKLAGNRSHSFSQQSAYKLRRSRQEKLNTDSGEKQKRSESTNDTPDKFSLTQAGLDFKIDETIGEIK